MIKKIFLLCIFLFNFFAHALTLDNINKDYITKNIVTSLYTLETSVQISSINKENYLLIKDRLIKDFLLILSEQNNVNKEKFMHYQARILYESLIYIYNFIKLEKSKKVKEFIAEINKIEDNFFLSLIKLINKKNNDVSSNILLQEINKIIKFNLNITYDNNLLLNNEFCLIDLIIKSSTNYDEQYVSKLMFFSLFYSVDNKQMVKSKELSLTLSLEDWYALCNIYNYIKNGIENNKNLDINSFKFEIDYVYFLSLKNAILMTHDNIFSAFEFIHNNKFIYSTIMINEQKRTFREFLLGRYLGLEIKKYVSDLEIKKHNNLPLKELEDYKNSILKSYEESMYFFSNEKNLIESIINKKLSEVIIKPQESLSFDINNIIDNHKKEDFTINISQGNFDKIYINRIKSIFDKNLEKLLDNIRFKYKKINNYEEYQKAYSETYKIIGDYRIDIQAFLGIISELKDGKNLDIKTYDDICCLIYNDSKNLILIKDKKIEDILKNNKEIYCDNLDYLDNCILTSIKGIDILFLNNFSICYLRKKITLNVISNDSKNVSKKYLTSNFLQISLPIYDWFNLLKFREATLLAYQNKDYIFYNQILEENYNILFEILITRIKNIEDLKIFEETNKYIFLNIKFNNKNILTDIINYFFDKELMIIINDYLIDKDFQKKDEKIHKLILKYKKNINNINYENVCSSISDFFKDELKNAYKLRNNNILKDIEKNIQNKINMFIPSNEEDIEKILKDVLGNDKQKSKKPKQKKQKKKEKTIKTKIIKKQEKSIEINITRKQEKQNNTKPKQKPKPKPKKQEFSLVDRIKNTGKKIKKVKKILTNPVSLIQNNDIIFSFLSPILQQKIHINHVDLMLKYSNNQNQYSNDIKTLCCNLLSELQGLKEFIYYFDQLETKIFLNEQFEEIECFFADYETSLQNYEINCNKLDYINYHLKRSYDVIIETTSRRTCFVELLDLNSNNFKYNLIENELCLLAEHTKNYPIEEGINSLDIARYKIDNYQKLIDLLGSIKQNFNDLEFYKNNLILIRDTLQKNNNKY